MINSSHIDQKKYEPQLIYWIYYMGWVRLCQIYSVIKSSLRLFLVACYATVYSLVKIPRMLAAG